MCVACVIDVGKTKESRERAERDVGVRRGIGCVSSESVRDWRYLLCSSNFAIMTISIGQPGEGMSFSQGCPTQGTHFISF